MNRLRATMALVLAVSLGWLAGCQKTPPAVGEKPQVSNQLPSPPTARAPAATESRPAAPLSGEGAAAPAGASEPAGAGPAVVEERYPNGKLMSQKHMKRDAEGKEIPHGLYQSWWENGQLRSQGEHVNGKTQGVWTYWHANGAKKGEGVLREEKPEGVWTYWYENGQKMAERTWVNGVLNGPHTTWHDNGQKADTANFVDGKPHGIVLTWDLDGVPQAPLRFEHGVKIEDSVESSSEMSPAPTGP